jgi:hypothetical protein
MVSLTNTYICFLADGNQLLLRPDILPGNHRILRLHKSR